MKKSIALLLSFILLSLAPLSARAAKGATEDLRITLDSVIALLADKKADPVKRRAQVVEKIRGDFDFEAMSKIILGPNWNVATDAQKRKFIDLYTRILEITYIERIEAYTDEKVKYGEEKLRGDKAAVQTTIIGAGKEIPVEYRMWLDKDNWRVYDVTIEGVSLVRNFQDTYKGVIRKDGIDGLLVQMEARIKEMELKK